MGEKPTYEELEQMVEAFRGEVENLRKAEKELRKSERRFKLMLENADDGVLVADAEKKKLCQSNKRLREMLGYSSEEIKNLMIHDLHPRRALLYVLDQFEKLSRREIPVTKDIPVKRKDDSIFYADISALRITLGEKIYLMGFFRDITGRKESEIKTPR